MQFHYSGRPNGVGLSAAVCQASPRSPPRQINQIVSLAVKLSGASIHRSVLVCAPSVRTNARANVRETLFYWSPYVKHAVGWFKHRRSPLLCRRDVTVDVETSADDTSRGRACVCISMRGPYGAREERTLINSSHRLGLSSHYGRYLTPWLGFARVKLLGLWPLGGWGLGEAPLRHPPPPSGPSGTFNPIAAFEWMQISRLHLSVQGQVQV